MPDCPQEPVLILSDVHLSWHGDWRARARVLAPLFYGMGTVIFNGDTTDWHVARNPVRLAAIKGELERLCIAAGARAVFLAGNSDTTISPLQHVVLARGAVLVTHGDAVFPDVSPWKLFAPATARARATELAKLPPALAGTLEGQLIATHACLGVVRRKDAGKLRWWHWRRVWHQILRVLWPAWLWRLARAWQNAPRLTFDFMAKYAPEHQFYLTGHTHRGGLWRRDNKTIFNTGSFVRPGRPLAVRISHGTIELIKINQIDGKYRLGSVVNIAALAAND
jgi:UDP-2,3-diacylglucosamine pyrophosphatase LpxH